MTPAGSQTTPAKDMPRTCAICGQRILTSKQAFQHHVNDLTGQQYAWHITCKQGRHTMNETTEPTTPEPTTPDPTEPNPPTSPTATMTDTEDLNTLAQMIELGTDYINEQDESDDQANIPAMKTVLEQLASLVPVEMAENEPPEPGEQE